jgi:CRP/FNR family cyclic AMP-dependent transcriptional regulator
VSAIAPIIATLQALDIFAGATRTALERLARSAAESPVTAGTVLIREGAAPDDFLVLTEGEVAISAAGESGGDKALGVIAAPNYFGEIGLLEHRPRTATVTATTSCTVLRIRGADFVDALTETVVSPAALGAMQVRLARTHPSLQVTFGHAEEP